jgi:nitrate reductase cytochrome c-type subunit
MRREVIMRRRTAITLGALVLVPVLIAGKVSTPKEPDDGIDVYFREADLGAVADQDLAAYIETEAGESENLERAFPGAPPMIPHTVVDMLPIATDDNECLECHHPENTTSEEEMPLPDSHFESAVMARGEKGQAMVWVVKGYEASDLVGNRFNCTMCHTPQATNVRDLPSRFVREKSKKK